MDALRVDAARLHEVSSTIMSAVSRIRFDRPLLEADDGAVGSPEVATAVRGGATQQTTRAAVTADALSAVGRSPLHAVASFAEADAALARAF